MDIWVVCDVYESEFEFSTHLTEKGALLNICAKILCFVDSQLLPDCDSEEDRTNLLWKTALENYRMDHDESWKNFNISNWRGQDKEALWTFYDFISEFTWDAHGVDFTISRTSVTA